MRRAGVLLHITSLPGEYGAGDLGPAAHDFVDFLADAGCTVWQVLPLVPTHPEDRSPYNGVSAMAGNPELVSLEVLVTDGLLRPAEVEAVRAGSLTRLAARELAARRVLADPPPALAEFTNEHQDWLEDFVTFVALGESQGGTPWVGWPAPLRDRDPAAVRDALEPLAERVDVLAVEQWFFADQWQRLRAHAADRGVLFFGDLPIFVSHDSADVWAHRELFELDADGRPTTVTGVPPDYFAAEGQRWNNPHYDWERMATDGFAWWRRRVARQRQLFDLVRIDHFRGFEAAWHVPADAPTAKSGYWVSTPGREVLTALVDAAGEGTLVAEDLGTITPEVVALRVEFGLPGMKVLQFAFDGDPDNFYLPAHHGENAVVYTGTHDNDTTLGWWESLDEATRERVVEVLAGTLGDADSAADDPAWRLVRLALSSPAVLAVVPAQDLLALGSEARMNTPGTDVGNWSWQAPRNAFEGRSDDEARSDDEGRSDDGLAARLRTLVTQTGRVGVNARDKPAESA